MIQMDLNDITDDIAIIKSMNPNHRYIYIYSVAEFYCNRNIIRVNTLTSGKISQMFLVQTEDLPKCQTQG